MGRRIGSLSGILAVVALLAVALMSPVHAAFDYRITVDTASLLGSAGYFDFQFNPGTTSAPGAQAALTDFSGNTVLVGGEVVDGDVTGSLPGLLLFSNTTPFNALLQPVTFGSTATFDLSFSGPFETASSGSNTRFSLGLLDSDFDPLLTVDPVGTVLQFELAPGSGMTAAAFDADLIGAPSAVSVAPVPLPAALSLFLSGLGVLFGRRRFFGCPEQ